MRHPVVFHPKAVLSGNIISLFHRIGHGSEFSCLLLVAHVGEILKLRHDDVTPDTHKVLKINNKCGLLLVVGIQNQCQPVTNTHLSANISRPSGIQNIVGHRVAVVSRKQHYHRVVASFTRQAIDGFVARERCSDELWLLFFRDQSTVGIEHYVEDTEQNQQSNEHVDYISFLHRSKIFFPFAYVRQVSIADTIFRSY